VLYPTGNLQPGWTGVPLRREPAITGLDWSFAPIPRSEKRIARQNSCRPPPEFPPASPCPGIDRPASGLTLVTSGLFRPCSWSRKRLRAYWFPCAFGVWKLLKLAIRVSSQCLPSWRRISDLRYSGVALVLVGYTYGTITLFGSPFQTNSA